MSAIRPILFSGPMIRAILAGTKTQTRRVIKRQPTEAEVAEGIRVNDCDGSLWALYGREYRRSFVKCPYGQPGDRLWVRETTHRRPMLNLLTGDPLDANYDGGAYSADGTEVLCPAEFDLAWWYSRKVCPSIHMPRWASRLTLEVVGVRVERVQDISNADAEAEGMDIFTDGCGYSLPGGRSWHRHAEDVFGDLWDAINAARGFSWGSNPWVWAVECKRVENGGVA